MGQGLISIYNNFDEEEVNNKDIRIIPVDLSPEEELGVIYICSILSVFLEVPLVLLAAVSTRNIDLSLAAIFLTGGILIKESHFYSGTKT